MPFADYFQKLVPTSFRRTWGGLYVKGLGEGFDGSADGVVRDDAGNPMTSYVDANGVKQSGAPAADYGIVARVRAAVKARFPDTPLGATATPDDALNAIGGERLLERGTGSAAVSAAYGTRLRQAWSSWQFGGTGYGLLRELWNMGYPNAYLAIVNGKSYHLVSNTGDPATDLQIQALFPQSWWPSPGSSPARTWWTRFAVIFMPHNAPAAWSTVLPSNSSDEVNAIRRVVKRWKPAFSICDRMIVPTLAAVWGFPSVDTGFVEDPLSPTWGRVGLNWGGANTVTYWDP